ncbi:MAG: alanine racemase [Saprospiraceae bacterium]|nr:alanine racemase [Saprospiraceae bacterium]
MNVTTPTVLLDQSRTLSKIDQMVQKARALGMGLRPHFKTHQSAEVARWFLAAGVRKATVSSVQMARYFVDAGWNDLTIAFPINYREWPEISQLADRAHINVILTCPEALPLLLYHQGANLGIFLKIDVGYHRTGFDPQSKIAITHCLDQLQSHPNYTFKGFLSHAGHTYACRTRQAIIQVHGQALGIMQRLKEIYHPKHPDLILSMGATPSCSVADNWQEVDEMRPGNFVFYDLTQVAIGSCEVTDVSVCLACPVVAKHGDRKTIVVYGGGVHLSKDRLAWRGTTIYGRPVKLDDQGWADPDDESYVTSLSQEHGVVQASDALFQTVQIGDLIGILPVHSCMMCDLMKSYHLLPDGAVVSMMSKEY